MVVEAKKKEDGDKEAPIDPENVNNPTEPMRIEERVRRKKKKKRAERRNPAGHCSTGERYKLFWMVVGLHPVDYDNDYCHYTLWSAQILCVLLQKTREICEEK